MRIVKRVYNISFADCWAIPRTKYEDKICVSVYVLFKFSIFIIPSYQYIILLRIIHPDYSAGLQRKHVVRVVAINRLLPPQYIIQLQFPQVGRLQCFLEGEKII